MPHEQPIWGSRGHHRGLVLRRQQPETRNRRAPAPIAIGLDAVDMDHERVAWFGPLHIERARLRIDFAQVDFLCNRPVRWGECVIGGIARAGNDAVARLDTCRRRVSIAVCKIQFVARIVLHFRRSRGHCKRKPGHGQQQCCRELPRRHLHGFLTPLLHCMPPWIIWLDEGDGETARPRRRG